MNVQILDGRIVRDSRIPELVRRVKEISRQPTLAIIQVGNRSDSDAFIAAKKSFAQKIGVKEKHINLPESASQNEVIKAVDECNHNPEITGLIVQLPLTEQIDKDAVIKSIDPKKDADGLLDDKKSGTARGVLELLEYYNIELRGKQVTVVGHSDLVGKPIAQMCLGQGAQVTVCDSQTTDLAKETKKADIIISAVGQPGLITADHVEKGQVVIDVGIVKTPEGRLVGDVDFESVKNIVAAITPVPGGVGPMTVLALFENLLDLA